MSENEICGRAAIMIISGVISIVTAGVTAYFMYGDSACAGTFSALFGIVSAVAGGPLMSHLKTQKNFPQGDRSLRG